MQQRLSVKDLEPSAYKAMFEMEKYLGATTVAHPLKELIKIRTSQINSCAYCIDLHAKQALKDGEDPQRIFALSAWRESPLFDEKEKAALKFTDEVTLIAQQGVTETTYQEMKHYFTDNEIAQMIMLIATYNTWNRIAVSTHMFHKKQL